MAKFKLGDLVRLNTSDKTPVMSITGENPMGQSYKCSWFAGSTSRDDWFPEQSLVPAESETSKK